MLSNSPVRSLDNPISGSATPARYSSVQKLEKDLKILLIGVLVIFINACGGGGGGGGSTSGPALSSIAIDQPSLTLAKGMSASLTATGTFSNGSESPITGEVIWISDNSAVAGIVENTGVVSGVGVGETMVTATKDGIDSSPIIITVTNAELTSIAITPITESIDKNTSVQFTATGTFSDNTTGDISNSVTWSASSAGVTVNNSGLATGTAAGSYTITASFGGITSNTATLTVTEPTLTAITISPSTAIIALAKGRSTNLTATGIYSNGSSSDITTMVAWTSADSNAVSVNSAGVVTGLLVTGGVTVTATMNTISKSTTIVVTDAELVSIAITPTTASIAQGRTTLFAAEGTYSDNNKGDISSQVTWSATPNGVSFSSSTATGNAEGTYSITAAMNNNTSNTPTLITSNTATLTVTPKVITAIAIAPANPHVLVGATLQLIATATYSDASTGVVTTSSSWSSSSPAKATIDTTGIATGVAVGSSTIFASKDSVDSPPTTLTVYLNSYTVGGTLSGLVSGNTITIANNGGSDLTLSANGTFTFTGILSDGKYPDGAAYNLSIVTLLTNQPCTLTYGAGNVNGANVVANIICGPQPATNLWSPTGSLGTARDVPSATLLPNGKLLVAGGVGDSGILASAELYDPATGTWSPTGALGVARYTHTATLLPDGKVLVTGGIGSGILASAELYDPATGTWSPTTASLSAARFSHTATLLPNGKVLIAGGHNGSNFLTSAELYDPATGNWSSAGSFAVGRYFHSSTLLPNGKVLIVGGNSVNPINSAQLYNPATNSWSAADSLSFTRENHTATLLPNGKVLVAGGSSNSAALASAELYDPDANIWSAAGILGAARYTHTAMLLPTGQVLAVGGVGDSGTLASAELYNPTTNIWSAATSLTNKRGSHTATLLPDGRLLAVGGSDGVPLLSAEIYW